MEMSAKRPQTRPAHHPRAHLEVVDDPLDHVEVAACRERGPLPGQDCAAHVRVGVDVAPDLGELAVHVGVGGVELARIAHQYPEHAFRRPLELQPLVAGVAVAHRHSFSRSCSRRR
jgi:hypothetical protein